ncbi:putative cell invasion protein-cytoplasmic [Yersinia ruckeri]|uniref:type III secretion system inner rod subunit SctI n=1 Tax=Yersinia ruckeri TaxID=29486 RepID=UPI0005AD1EF4|nr:type III secretion system inner rod subunit SctI [Yersinia ruckeri]AJI95186.1 putative cell invasion protein-cytoplasmic [Yersinia ruckeri]MCW6566879.1 type III secretion system inner rod subunit SctI [Yersinia ruckeri]
MSYFINFLPIKSVISAAEEISAVGTESLEEKVKNLFSQQAVTSSQEKAALENWITHGNITNPAELLAYQKRHNEYTTTMTFASSLTHKAVSAVETLIKSQ